MPYGFDPRKLGWKPYRDPILPPQYPWESVDSQLFYNGNGNTGGTPPTNWGSGSKTVVSAGNLVKEGYTFKEWNTNSNGTGTSYQPGSTITIEFTSITLYAIWEAVSQQLVAPSDALILKAQLLNGDIINGRVGASTGYYRILYWDGTHEIISNTGTYYNGENNFQKTCTTSPDGTMASYGPKTIKIWSCDQNGNVSGDITDLKLTNDKYHEFVLDNITKIKHLSINNNSIITQSNLNFSLLTDIQTITLNNLQAFTGTMSLPNIPNWLQPNFASSDGTFTSDRSQWTGLGYIYKVF